MKVIELDRPFNGIDQKLGYYIVVVPANEDYRVGLEVEVRIHESKFMSQHGVIEDIHLFSIDQPIHVLDEMLMKDAFGFSMDWIKDYLRKTGSSWFQILGIRSITYAYQSNT